MGKRNFPRRGKIWLVKMDKERTALIIQSDKLTEDEVENALLYTLGIEI